MHFHATFNGACNISTSFYLTVSRLFLIVAFLHGRRAIAVSVRGRSWVKSGAAAVRDQ